MVTNKNGSSRAKACEIWNNYWNWWKRFSEGSLAFLGIMLLLSLPYVSVFSSLGGKQFFVRVGGFLAKDLFGLFLVALMTWILRPLALRRVIRGVLVGAAGILCAGELFFLWRYGAMPDAAIMEIVIATNPHEAAEFIRMYVWNVRVVAGVLGGVLLLAALWRLLHCARKNVWMARGMAVCFAGTLALSVISVIRHPEVPISERLAHWPQQYFSIGYAVHETIRAAEDLSSYETMLNGHTDEDVVLTRNEDDLPYVVFVQGESTSRNHMSLYGYPLETSPRLQAREEAGELTVFSDVVSPHSHTMPVMEKLYTFYRYGMPGEWYQQHNLFDILHVAGIHTAWISNQECAGIYGNAGRVYASKCDVSRFTMMNSSGSGVIQKHDEALLPILDEVLGQTTAERNFFVVHLMGTHGDYTERYPAAFAKFAAADETVGCQSSAAKKTRAEYDNAVLYNDFIVDEILRRFEDKDAIVIYMSDHADEVMEDREYAGHDETSGTHWMIEIPMVVWMSQTFRERHPDRAALVCAAASRPYMTDDMIHSFLDLLHVETAEYRPECSIFNERFDATRERIYAGKPYRKGEP